MSDERDELRRIIYTTNSEYLTLRRRYKDDITRPPEIQAKMDALLEKRNKAKVALELANIRAGDEDPLDDRE